MSTSDQVNWPPFGYREISYAEAQAIAGRHGTLDPSTRYCKVAEVRVECSCCHREYTVAAISTTMPLCPYCRIGLPYYPQMSLDLDPYRDARERAQRLIASWPPIADRRDWQFRNKLNRGEP